MNRIMIFALIIVLIGVLTYAFLPEFGDTSAFIVATGLLFGLVGVLRELYDS